MHLFSTYLRKDFLEQSTFEQMKNEEISLENLVTYHSVRWTENNKNILGEYKMITKKQQFLGIILCFSMYLKWTCLLSLFV